MPATARVAGAAILAVMLCQVVFLVWGCDWDLCGDEAEYWAWSRRLAWSYYSRGPVIAWLIRLATELLGDLSRGVDRIADVRGSIPGCTAGRADRLGYLPAGLIDDWRAARRDVRRVTPAGRSRSWRSAAW